MRETLTKMLNFKNPSRWEIYSRLWCVTSAFVRSISRFLPPFGRPLVKAPDEDVEQLGATDRQPPNKIPEESGRIIFKKGVPSIKPSSDVKLLMVGMFAEVYLLKGSIVRKVPCNDAENGRLAILCEATVYSILGKHPRIVEWLSCGETDFVEIQYYPNGDLAARVLDEEKELPEKLRRKWFQQIIEAIVKIHEHDVIHSDLALRQLFLDDNMDVRLGDFNLSQYPGHIALGYEKVSHCLPRNYEDPNSIHSDLFALGSTLYELVARKAPYNELYPREPEAVLRSRDQSVIQARVQRQWQVDSEIEALYKNKEFPNVTKFFGGDIILGCWDGSISSASDALELYKALILNPHPG
ncbi:kinase-like protein [Xylona heveae TC161]|uniref:non-specific serine/threonine protein kinase n=1 Tax=Xylona heveae (strain CBS 132557 / TC161) TaxID=1328760 RepID=A0A165AGY5_XYLHT|nr:kinase-like protein [Xylona heveae TC161]KZF20454.1 kinase-like protein [Xylona heveae TC161]